MDSKVAQDERQRFSERLKAAIASAGLVMSPAAFVKAFNARADGASITIHAARKWLHGEAIPTHEKIVILAVWLGVNAGWLRFGTAANDIFGAGVMPEAEISTPALALINDIMSLPERERRIVRGIVDVFMREFGDSPTMQAREAEGDEDDEAESAGRS